MGQKVILCYGDSNTWGYVPSPNYQACRRYDRIFRWTGVLQDLLGPDYYVIEEGLNGRTTNINHIIEPDRNGKTYLPPCLYSHAPVDLFILALGGNDLNICFNRSAVDIKNAIVELIYLVRETKCGANLLSSPKILLLSPPVPLNVAEDYSNPDMVKPFLGAIEKAKKLQDLLANVASVENLRYLNIDNVARPSVLDGLHFNVNGHLKIARALHTIIRDIFSTRWS